MAIDGADADARALGHILDARLQPVRREERASGFEDGVAIPGGVGSERSIGRNYALRHSGDTIVNGA
jgi:hypothetical protein